MHVERARGLDLETDASYSNDYQNGADPLALVQLGLEKAAEVAGTVMAPELANPDEDTYQLGTLTAGDRVELTVTLPSGSSLVPHARVFDQAGVEVADEDGQPDGDFAATLPAGGTYYAQVLQPFWTLDGVRYELTEPLSWSQAEAEAQALGGHLVSIDDAALQAWVTATFGGQNLWIGLNDVDQEGSFVWSDGSSVDYTNWAPGEPNQASYDYVYLSSNGKWYDLPDNQLLRGLVERPDPDGLTTAGAGPQGQYVLSVSLTDPVPPAVVSIGGLPAAGTTATEGLAAFQVQLSEELALDSVHVPVFHVFAGHTYLRSDDPQSWTAARSWAEGLGAHLVSITSAAEQDQLHRHFGNVDYWIGLNDIDTPGSFQWTSGEPLSYTHWAPGEPNQSNFDAVYTRALDGWWHDYPTGSSWWAIAELAQGSLPDGDGDGLPDSIDPYPTEALNAVDLREAGADGVFLTADDERYLVQLDALASGSTLLQLSVVDGPLSSGSYRLTLTSVLQDLVGNGLDGDGDGVAGDPFVHEFTVALPSDLVWEGQGNHSLSEAVPLQLQEDPAASGYAQTVTFGQGALAPAGDADWWQVQAEAGDRLALWSDPAPGSDLGMRLYLYNELGQNLTSGYLSGPAGGAYVSGYQVQTTGTYYAQVVYVYGTPGQLYQVHVERARGLDLETDAAYSNDNQNGADPVALAAAGSKSIGAVAGTVMDDENGNVDEDYFQLGAVDPDETILLSVALPSTSPLAPLIEIRDGSGQPVEIEVNPSGAVARHDVASPDSFYAVLIGTGGAGPMAQYLIDVAIQPTDELDFADLAVASVTAPAQASSGETIAVQWEVGNFGALPTETDVWNDLIVLSTDAQFGNGDDVLLGAAQHAGVLAVGESYLASLTVALPVGIAGERRIFVQTDSDDQVKEFIFEANNVSTEPAAVDVALTPAADLAAGPVLVSPDLVIAGAPLTFQWTVSNEGLGATGDGTPGGAVSQWTDRLLLSADGVLGNADDVVLADVAHDGVLAPGATYDGLWTGSPPAGLSGTYGAWVSVDADSAVVQIPDLEPDEASAPAPVTFVPVPYADLAVTSASAAPGAVAGGPLGVAWTVENTAAALVTTPVGAWEDRVYLSADAQPGNGDDLLLGTHHHSGELPVGASYSVAMDVPALVPSGGAWHLYVQTDAGQSVFEGGLQANNQSALVPMTLSIANLAAAFGDPAPAEAQLGAALSVPWTVTNDGDGATPAAAVSRLWLSADAAPGGDDLLLAETTPAAVDAGESIESPGLVQLPGPLELPAGDYWLLLVADALDAVVESNEADNLALRALKLTYPPAPDLAVEGVSGAVAVQDGVQLTVNWTVSNGGAAEAGMPWTETLWLATDPVASPNGTLVLTQPFEAAGSLAPGASLARSATVPVPVSLGLAGTLWPVVRVQASPADLEPLLADNLAVAATPVDVPPALGLVATGATLAEGAGEPLIAVVSRSGDPSMPLAVDLEGTGSELSLAPQVTIPAEQTSAIVAISAPADATVEGDEPAAVTASAAGYLEAGLALTVTDTTAASLALDLPASTLDEGGVLAASVALGSSAPAATEVTLWTSHASRISLPDTVTIPQGALEAGFPVVALANASIEDTEPVEIRAFAAGGLEAQAILLLVDDDAPLLSLALPEEIAEGDGLGTTPGTVSLEAPAALDLVIGLASQDPSEIVVPPAVAIAAGESSASFPIYAVDDALDDGPQAALIVAQNTETLSSQPIAAGLASAAIQVTDDDGPALAVDLAPQAVPEGVTGAVTLTVSRNGPTAGDLTANLQSSDAGELAVPPTVVLPDGEASVAVAADSLDDGVPDGAQPVTVTASAPGFDSGSDTVLVSDSDLPDLVPGEVAVLGPVLTGELATVRYRISNPGLAGATATAAAPLLEQVWVSDDPVPGDDVLVASAEFTGSIPPGPGYERTLSFFAPPFAGESWIFVAVDGGGAIDELDEANNTAGGEPFSVLPAYDAVVQAAVESAPVGTAIPLVGSATLHGGAGPAAFELVNVHVRVQGMLQVVSAFTDAQGNFQLQYQPLPGAGGLHTVGAAHPGQAAAPVQGSFTLWGLGAQAPPAVLAPQAELAGVIALENLGDVPVSGLEATVVAAPPSVAVSASLPAGTTVAGLDSIPLAYTLTSLAAEESSGVALLRVSGPEVSLDVPIPVEVLAPEAQLGSPQQSLSAGMVPGTQAVLAFELQNEGGGPTGPIDVLLPKVPWISSASPTPLPGLEPGTSATVSLLLTPPPDLPLGPHEGSVVLVAEDDSLSLPFELFAVSDATGDLAVHVVDEYFYFTAEQPKLEGATVTVRDAFTQAVVAEAQTDVSGEVLFEDIPASVYAVSASAPQHESETFTVFLQPGELNETQVFLSQVTVTYTWTVEEIELEDKTEITIEAVFETDVPVPVVVADPPSVDLTELEVPGETMQVDITFTNHGLIAADHLEILLQSNAFYDIAPLITDLGLLPAKSSITVPFLITRILPDEPAPEAGAPEAVIEPGGRGRARARRVADRSPDFPLQLSASTGECNIIAGYIYDYVCGDLNVPKANQIPFLHKNCFAGATAGSPGPYGGWSTYLWIHQLFANYNPDVDVTGPKPTPEEPGDPLPEYTPPPPLFEIPVDCTGCFPKLLPILVDCVLDFLPLPKWYECLDKAYDCLKNPDLNWVEIADCFRAMGWCLGIETFKATPIYKIFKCAALALVECPPDLGGLLPLASTAGAAGASESTHPDLAILAQRLEWLAPMFELLAEFLGDAAWTEVEAAEFVSPFLTTYFELTDEASESGFRISPAEAQTLQALPKPPVIDAAHVDHFVERWNRSVDYWEAGIFDSTDVPAGQSQDFLAIDVLSSLAESVDEGIQQAEALGFESPDAAVHGAIQDLFDDATSSSQGVCAKVTVQLSQNLILTKSAFTAQLSIVNSSAEAVTQVGAELVVFDANGVVATELFGIQGPLLTNLDASDGTGTIDPGLTGAVTWTIIPSHDAAPLETTEYFVGGSLQYLEHGTLVAVPLTPSPIQVRPDAALEVDYFHERDVFADDPFTPAVEPSVPYSLGVLVANTGAGIAENLSITSSQPVIVENEKGLLIHFEILATQVGLQNLLPSLTLSFGDVNPDEVAVGRWLFQSSLQGKFIEYDATFQHVSPIGGAEYSQLESVDIHELIHVVLAGGPAEDELPDFLVNELLDGEALPDTVYLSDGSTALVGAASGASFDGAPSPLDLEVELTLTMPASYGYARLPDPGAGDYRLVAVTRADGTALPAEFNFWQTDRTFPVGESHPVYENLLHLFDFGASGSTVYRLTYEPVDLVGPTAAALEAVVPDPRTTPVESLDVTFSESVDPASVDTGDFLLTRDGAPVDLGGAAVEIVSPDTLRLSQLSALTAADGVYVLTAAAGGVSDLYANPGTGSVSEEWVVAAIGPTVAGFPGAPQGLVSAAPAALEVQFSEPLEPSSFDAADLALTRDGEAWGGPLAVAPLGETSFQVSGLDAAPPAGGVYELAVLASGVLDVAGNAGVGQASAAWELDLSPPQVEAFDGGGALAAPPAELQVTFSEPLAPGSFGPEDLALQAIGAPAPLPAGVAVEALDTQTYRITGFGAAGAADGDYALAIALDGLSDAAGNPGAGTASLAWTLDTAPPGPATQLAIAPDTGVFDGDLVTSQGTFVLSGVLAEPGLAVEVFDLSEGVLQGPAAVDGLTFCAEVSTAVPGVHALRVRSTDAAGNAADALATAFVDLTPVVVLGSPAPPGPSAELAVDTVDVDLSEPVDPASFSPLDLQLTHDGGPDLIDASVSVTPLSPTRYRIGGLAPLNALPGSYELTVAAAGLLDCAGNPGVGQLTLPWERIEKTWSLSLAAIPDAWGTVEGAGEYPDGTAVAIHAEPAPGYTFVAWFGEGAADPSSPDTTVTLDGDRALVAAFTKRGSLSLMANGETGSLTLSTQMPLQVTLEVKEGPPGVAADWWLLLESDAGAFHGAFAPILVLLPGKGHDAPLFTGELTAIGPLALFPRAQLPAGEYELRFGYDLNPDGLFDQGLFVGSKIQISVVKRR